MKYQEAIEIINKNKQSNGFMVHFEVKEGGVLRSDHFPDKRAGEELIPTEAEAWDLAYKFASATDHYHVNVYVTDDQFRPVRNYDSKAFKRYVPGVSDPIE